MTLPQQETTLPPVTVSPCHGFAHPVRVAVAALVLCCVLWGWSFPVMQKGAAAMERVAFPAAAQQLPGGSDHDLERLGAHATFNGWRFMAAAVLYLLLTRRWQHGHTWSDLKAGAAVGGFLGAGMFLQLVGLRYTLPSVSSFLTALTVVFSPLGQAWITRQRVGVRTWGAVAVATAGIVILSRANPGAAAANTLAMTPPVPYLGEILTIVGAVLFSGQILAVDHFGERNSPYKLTAVSLGVTGVLNAAGGVALGAGELYRPETMGRLVADVTFLWSMPTLILFCSVLAMHLMNRFQPLVSPAAASVIYCLEPVFATFFSALMQAERITQITLAGGTVIVVAVLIAAGVAGRRRESDALPSPVADAPVIP